MTTPARRLPAPRPALRKAHDSEHHPAAGPSAAAHEPVDLPTPADDLTDEAETTAAEPVGEAVPDSGGGATIGKRGPGQTRSAAATAFWEALRTDAAAALERSGPSDDRGDDKGKRGKSKSGKKKFHGATSDVLRIAKPDDERDLLLGKQASLEVRVPKRLRKAAKAQAERHGTTLDNVVTGLLAGWVDGS